MMPSRYCVCQGRVVHKECFCQEVSHRPAKGQGTSWSLGCVAVTCREGGRKEEHSRKPDGHSMSLWDEVLWFSQYLGYREIAVVI